MSKNHVNRTVQYILMALNLVSIRYVGIVDFILNRIKNTFFKRKEKDEMLYSSHCFML